jgi:hypothetical protein
VAKFQQMIGEIFERDRVTVRHGLKVVEETIFHEYNDFKSYIDNFIN